MESLLEIKSPVGWGGEEYDEKILGFFIIIAVYLLHLVDFVESVLIHVNEKTTLHTIYSKMNLLFIFVAVKNSLIAIKVKNISIFLFSTFIVLKVIFIVYSGSKM